MADSTLMDVAISTPPFSKPARFAATPYETVTLAVGFIERALSIERFLYGTFTLYGSRSDGWNVVPVRAGAMQRHQILEEEC